MSPAVATGRDRLCDLTRLVAAMLLIGIVLSLSACTTRPADAEASRTLIPSEAVAIDGQATPANAKALRDLKPRLTMLALSGGGAHGAYGVGVLTGWTESGTRPEFDIVTGVSTGALMGVLAFLGPDYDPTLRDLYITQMREDFFRAKNPVAGLLSDSLFDNSGLVRQIEEVVDEALLERIAREHARGRRLYVGTTNLDANKLVVWDMGVIASDVTGREDRVALFRQVLVASTAIPVLFPPVYIRPDDDADGLQAHVDGAVKAPILLSDFLFQKRARTKELYVIVNGSLELLDASAPIEPNLRSIAQNAAGGASRELTQQIVYRGYVRARNTGARYSLTAAPPELIAKAGALEFEPRALSALFEAGREAVQRSDFWWDRPPTLRKFDTVPARANPDR